MSEGLVQRVREALESDKCSDVGPFNPSRRFEALIREDPELDLTETMVPLLVKGNANGLHFPGQACSVGIIYVLRLPYSKIPELVEDERVLRIEASPGEPYITYDSITSDKQVA